MINLRRGWCKIKQEYLLNVYTNINCKIKLPLFKFSNSVSKDPPDSKNNSHTTKKENQEGLNPCVYDEKEFDRSIDDPTDKTKPYDNMFTKVSRPDLKEQYEKRKDIFHTKDTPYLKKEKENEDKENVNNQYNKNK